MRNWIRQQQVDAGQRDGVSTETAAEIRELKKRNRELEETIEVQDQPPGGSELPLVAPPIWKLAACPCQCQSGRPHRRRRGNQSRPHRSGVRQLQDNAYPRQHRDNCPNRPEAVPELAPVARPSCSAQAPSTSVAVCGESGAARDKRIRGSEGLSSLRRPCGSNRPGTSIKLRRTPSSGIPADRPCGAFCDPADLGERRLSSITEHLFRASLARMVALRAACWAIAWATQPVKVSARRRPREQRPLSTPR